MSESLNFSDKDKREENIRFLYSKAIDARNFHYDNFTKWQTFFYIAVGSVLVAYCTLLTTEECRLSGHAKLMYPFLLRLLPVLGYAFSLIWLCSSRGYTLWWNSYMHIVQNFERTHVLPNASNVDFAVFTVMNKRLLRRCPFCLTQGANFSTSRLSNALAFVSAFSWSCVVCFGTLNWRSWWLVLLGAIGLTWGGSILLQCSFSSDLSALKHSVCDAPKKTCSKCTWRIKLKRRGAQCLGRLKTEVKTLLPIAAFGVLVCFALHGCSES